MPQTKSDTTGEKMITVKQIRSTIANKPKTRGTLRALGLRKIGDTNTLPDRPEIRGMIARVPHLIEVTDEREGTDMRVDELAPSPGRTRPSSASVAASAARAARPPAPAPRASSRAVAARSPAASKVARCRSSSASRS